MDSALESALRDVWQHVTSDRQSWLLGAGISSNAGVPLMYPLTEYVQVLIAENNPEQRALLGIVRDQLPTTCHIEHILSQIGDLISVADRSKSGQVAMNGRGTEASALRSLHNSILENIGFAVRYGYRPPTNGKEEVRGSVQKPIVTVEDHRAFVHKLFAARMKPGFHQSPISFFVLNYDTLLEDALALQQIPFLDGFLGGAMAYWAPEVAYAENKAYRINAKVFKLHGSVDWHLSEERTVIRCRDCCAYPNKAGNLLIYPQSTKYIATQKDPFASLFSFFRNTLATGPDNVLGICGYSFGDEHINGEIEAAMSAPGSKTVIVAFAKEVPSNGSTKLPAQLEQWLTKQSWCERVFVASSHGLYHGNLKNLYADDSELGWWKFSGLTSYLGDGPEIVPLARDSALTNETAAPTEEPPE